MRESEPEPQLLLQKYPLRTLYFYLTGDCNLACRHCWLSPRYQKTAVSQAGIPYDIFTAVIAEAIPIGLISVKLTGGEPLIHPRIPEILSFLREKNLGLTVESNGTVLKPELASQIAAGKDPFLSISLDGSDAVTHEWVRGVPGSFDLAVDGIRTAVDAGIRPQIIMTLMRRNVHQIESLIDLAAQLGAGSVKINILQPTARGKILHDQGEGLSIQELVKLGSWIERDIARNAGIPVLIDHPFAFRPLSRLLQQDRLCSSCQIHHILGVLNDGSYALCGIGATVPELIFGLAGRDHLSDVWLTNQTLHHIRNGIPAGLRDTCSRCVMKNLCHGSCVAANYALFRDLFQSYWYCQEAESLGLFPGSRLIISENNDGVSGTDNK